MSSLREMRVHELRKLAVSMGLDDKGLRKDELIAAIEHQEILLRGGARPMRGSRSRSATPMLGDSDEGSDYVIDSDFEGEFDDEEDDEDGDIILYRAPRAPRQPSRYICHMLLVLEFMYLVLTPGPIYDTQVSEGRAPKYWLAEVTAKFFEGPEYWYTFSLWVFWFVVSMVFAVVYVWVWDKHSKRYSVLPFAVFRFSGYWLFRQSALMDFSTLFAHYVPENLFQVTCFASAALAYWDHLVSANE